MVGFAEAAGCRLGAARGQSRHRFDDALRDLSQALALAPRNAQAWLTQAAILRVRASIS